VVEIISLRRDHELGSRVGTFVLEEKWPVLGRHERAVWVACGCGPTLAGRRERIDAYARGLAEYVRCASERASTRSPRVERTSPPMCVS